MSDKEWLPTEKVVEDYHLYKKMLESLASELRELSKKKQEGVLNLTKVKMVNRVLAPLKETVLANVPAHLFLDLLDEDTLPNNSDVVLIISQYEAAIEEFENTYYRRHPENSYAHYWATVENPDGYGEESEYDEEDDEDEDED